MDYSCIATQLVWKVINIFVSLLFDLKNYVSLIKDTIFLC